MFKDFDEKKYFVGEYLNGKKWKGKFIKIKNDKIKCKAVYLNGVKYKIKYK